MNGDNQIIAALIGASAAVGVGVVTWVLGQVTTFFEYRRKKNDERDASSERSRAVLHGLFAVCNFVNGRLNDWDRTRNVYDLARLSAAQSYVTTLIDRSPHENEVLSVSLFDLGLRLENLLFIIGGAVGEGSEEVSITIENVTAAVDELGRSVEVMQLLLDSDVAMISDEELAEIVANNARLDQSGLNN